MKFYPVLFFIAVLVSPGLATGQRNERFSGTPADTISPGLRFLEKYLIENPSWFPSSPEVKKNVEGLAGFIVSQPIDSILKNLGGYNSTENFKYVDRLPENTTDTLDIPGYISSEQLSSMLEGIERTVKNEFQGKEITVPVDLLDRAEKNAGIIPPGEGMRLFNDSVYAMPENLKFLDAVPDTMIQSAADFKRILHLDSIRDAYVEQCRKMYNDSVIRVYRDSVILAYRNEEIRQEISARQNFSRERILQNNNQLVRIHNDQIVKNVNDTIRAVLSVLSNHANNIDSANVWFSNLSNRQVPFTLKNNNPNIARVWVKNEQNDSLSVLLRNTGKRSIKMLIDDGVTFSRFSQKQFKEFDFNQFKPKADLDKISSRYNVTTPWTLSGNGSFGFTQMFLDHWVKGGNSSFAFLAVLKGAANYSLGKIKWENSAEFRNGWIRQGGDIKQTQKNDDKVEFISRFGVSAFKKWYYSTEVDVETQLFNGYNYTTDKLISGYLSPVKTSLKIGLDYKPSNNLSLLLSPLTSKTVYIRDTARIDQTTYGIDADKKRLWKPGLNLDFTYKRDLIANVTYETKYKMFINYLAPFSKFDVNWENTVTARLTNLITMTFMLYLIYDDDVTFATNKVNAAGGTIYEPSWQVKEMITVGLTYKFDRKVYKAKKVR